MLKLGKYEVTFDEYDLFAAATGCDKPGDQGWGRDGWPVINVSWNAVAAYAQWLSERTGLNYRLPSEAEWEYAARAGTKSPYYWEEATRDSAKTICGYANLLDRSMDESNYLDQRTKEIWKQQGIWEPVECSDGYVNTAPVRSFLTNTFGLHNMSGNVWEWVRDCYQNSYKQVPDDGSSVKQEKCPSRVLRGGSWNSEPQNVRSADRGGYSPDDRDNDIGFRLARTL